MLSFWVSIEEALHLEIVEYRNWDEEVDGPYNGDLTATDEAIWGTFADPDVVDGLFRVDRRQGRDWYLYLLNIVDQQIDDVIDFLNAQHSGRYNIAGCWHYEDGRQHGTEWDEGVLTGNPTYPIPNFLLSHMPTIKSYDENGDLISETEPTVNTDVNLITGQAPRRFT
jgi:hypothetical protein